jgi:lipopolysaccharide biosynthesis glycosyltransferase
MNLILTIAIIDDKLPFGNLYKSIADITHVSIKDYANKIGADFLCIDKFKISNSTPHWEKFQIYDLLNKYERILFIDTDIIIREDCPNIFDVVPLNKIGLFNEAPYTERSKEMMINSCKEYDIKLPSWNGKYYNTGVMVISRCHKYLFKKPNKEYNGSFWEQTYINIKIAENNLEVFELNYKFNRMTCMDQFTGEERHASYIIHYAGCPNPEWVLNIIPKDLQRWKDNNNNVYRRHLYVSVSGGLGDQICAEPAIRFMQKYIYPNDEIVVATHFPRLFKHLNSNLSVIEHGKFNPSHDTPYFLMSSLPGPETVTWMIVSNLLSHTVDYCSIALLKRILAVKDKQVHLEVTQTDIDCISDLVDKPEELILVHPGKHWQSKPQPLYSLIKTPDGWISMGDIKVKNVVCTPDGGTSFVTGVYPRGMDEIYRITFEDGRFADCTKDHLWKVYHENWRYDWKGNLVKNPYKIKSLKEILEYKSKRPLYIPLPEPVFGKKVNLPIDPYVLGCLLGDGCFSQKQSLQFSNGDNEIIKNIKNKLIKGYSIKRNSKFNFTITKEFGNKGETYRTILKRLNLWGKHSCDKFIPNIYKEAPSEDRFKILQGLMDTDGFAGLNSVISFYTISHQLALDVQYIVRSIGGLCKINKKERDMDIKINKVKYCGESILYTCLIRHDNPDLFFKTSRKKKRAVKIKKNIIRKCKIKKIEYIGRHKVQCIKIDHPESLYITNNFVVTHNTLPTQYWQDIINGLSINHRVAIIGREDGNRGTVNVTCPKNVIDLRNLLDLGALIALISKAKLLISNDSAPIHIAGAFDNLIVLLPTCKHPDHVLPYRNGSTYHKAIALYKKLPSDEFDSRPTCVEGSSAEINFSDWDKYLMDPKLIIENTEELLNKYE